VTPEPAVRNQDKKAVLSQRWPRNAHPWVPWKFSGLPHYAHGYFPPNFSWAFVLIHLVNVPTKFKVRSFTRSWDNKGYPKNLGSPWICSRSLFSNSLMGFSSYASYECTCQIRRPYSFTCSFELIGVPKNWGGPWLCGLCGHRLCPHQWRRQLWEFTRSWQGPENICQVLKTPYRY